MTTEGEWKEFKVGVPYEPPKFNPTCIPLGRTYHVAHVSVAHQILAQGKLRAGLIHDKSKLNTHRILVNWFSPNSWVNGSRYGNIQFAFEWSELVKGLNYYWVEAMTYNVKAPRLLATSKNHDDLLQRYDPTKGDGPWWHDPKEDKHYWNSEITLELMVESDVVLSRCVEIEFIKHHPNFCCLDYRRCLERDMADYRAAFRFLAGHIAGFGFASSTTPGWSGPPIKPRQLSDAWEFMEKVLSRRVTALSHGTITAQDSVAPVLARTLFRTFAASDRSEIDVESLKLVAALFADQGAVLDACQAEFTRVFGKLDQSLP
ncbi:hypothetical protein [Hyalangium versicolor]|uniref:hypothetical protein n=1 Tax=Hyalangium versicolor TaxID=2861190 RepID=UPI001CCBBA65|nr:hypothetical protein [Hyalangium versicolor]